MFLQILMASLPQNFQDGVTTVRKLHLRYLWIDALCIIQDSKSDCERETARMPHVYGSSHLTIAATSAASSTDGFLQRQPRYAGIKIAGAKMPYYSGPNGAVHQGGFSSQIWWWSIYRVTYQRLGSTYWFGRLEYQRMDIPRASLIQANLALLIGPTLLGMPYDCYFGSMSDFSWLPNATIGVLI